MHIFKEGDRSKAICDFDKRQVETIFERRTVPFSSGQGLAKGILAAVCTECGHVVSIPQQSVPRIRDAIKRKRRPLEARLPGHVVDVFYSSCFKLGGPGHWRELEVPLLSFYVHWFLQGRSSPAALPRKLASSSLTSGLSEDRLSMKVSEVLYEEVRLLSVEAGLSLSELLKALILEMNDDILEKSSGQRYTEFKRAIETLMPHAEPA